MRTKEERVALIKAKMQEKGKGEYSKGKKAQQFKDKHMNRIKNQLKRRRKKRRQAARG